MHLPVLYFYRFFYWIEDRITVSLKEFQIHFNFETRMHNTLWTTLFHAKMKVLEFFYRYLYFMLYYAVLFGYYMFSGYTPRLKILISFPSLTNLKIVSSFIFSALRRNRNNLFRWFHRRISQRDWNFFCVSQVA